MSYTVCALLCSYCFSCVVPRHLEWHEAGWYYVLIHQFFQLVSGLKACATWTYANLLLVLKPLTGVTLSSRVVLLKPLTLSI